MFDAASRTLRAPFAAVCSDPGTGAQPSAACARAGTHRRAVTTLSTTLKFCGTRNRLSRSDGFSVVRQPHDEIGSAATKGEGRRNVLCAYLAGALLIGLAGNAIAGAWWLDPLVGLVIVAVAVREGVEAWRGEGCCVASPLDGLDGCQDECCR